MKNNLEKLKELSDIVLPNEFTYISLNEYFQSESEKEKTKNSKAVTYINTDSLKIDDMTYFNERGKKEEKEIPINSKEFIIRVLIPKNNLSVEEKRNLNIDNSYEQRLNLIYGNKKPRLFNTEIKFFGSSFYDAETEKNIDVLYGVREEDIDKLYSAINRALNSGKFEDLGANLHMNRLINNRRGLYNISSFQSNLIKGSVFENEYYSSLNTGYYNDYKGITM